MISFSLVKTNYHVMRKPCGDSYGASLETDILRSINCHVHDVDLPVLIEPGDDYDHPVPKSIIWNRRRANWIETGERTGAERTTQSCKKDDTIYINRLWVFSPSITTFKIRENPVVYYFGHVLTLRPHRIVKERI